MVRLSSKLNVVFLTSRVLLLSFLTLIRRLVLVTREHNSQPLCLRSHHHIYLCGVVFPQSHVLGLKPSGLSFSFCLSPASTLSLHQFCSGSISHLTTVSCHILFQLAMPGLVTQTRLLQLEVKLFE